jgi:DNA-binding NarL/FixJ family response regulator
MAERSANSILEEIRYQLDALGQTAERSNSLLRALLRIMIEADKNMPLGRKIEVLDSAGLRPLEIAQILGISANNVSVHKSRMKKRVGEPANQKSETTEPSPATS